MHKLFVEYRQVGRLLFLISTLAVGVIYKNYDWILNQAQWLPEWILLVMTSPTVYGLVYLGGLQVYERWGWSIRHPELDCHGWWYFKAWKRGAGEDKQFVSSGTALIEQTALTMRIRGNSNVSTYWQVRCIAFNERLQGFIAYTGLSDNEYDSCLDNMCGIARFGAEYPINDKNNKASNEHQAKSNNHQVKMSRRERKMPQKLIFVCQEMRRGCSEVDTLDIVYTRDPDESFPSASGPPSSGSSQSGPNGQSPIIGDLTRQAPSLEKEGNNVGIN